METKVTRKTRKKLLRQYVKNLGYDYGSISLEQRKEFENHEAFQMLLTSTITGFYGEVPEEKKFSFKTFFINSFIIFVVLEIIYYGYKFFF